MEDEECGLFMNEILYKIDIQKILDGRSKVKLELGCGETKNPERVGIDRLDLKGVDIVADLENGLPFFPDNSIDEIYSKSFFEHIDNFEGLMKDIWRILRPEGKLSIFVPHFSNPYYYSDFTHKRFFGLYSFEYFSKQDRYFKRKVPTFYQPFGFKTISARLYFYSPFISRKPVKKALQWVVNLSKWTQEFYEENLCYLFPCYGIEAVLIPLK